MLLTETMDSESEMIFDEQPKIIESNPLVSIVIGNYNYERFINEAINSALHQTYKNIEVIVVDDGSQDKSREIISSYGDQVITVFKENGGQPSNYNAGFAASRGEIICFLDSDDIFIPDKIAKIVNIFNSYEEIGWCFHSLKLTDEKLQPLNFTTTRNYSSRECDFRSKIKAGRIPPSLPSCSALSFKRSLLEKILPMPTTKKMPGSDHYVKYIAVGLSKGFILGEDLTLQRIHGSNMGTLKTNLQHMKMRARENLFTSLWIRQKFPQFKNFANKLLVVGKTVNREAGNDLDNYQIIQNYLSSVSWNEEININFMLFYYYLKSLKNQLNNWLFVREHY